MPARMHADTNIPVRRTLRGSVPLPWKAPYRPQYIYCFLLRLPPGVRHKVLVDGDPPNHVCDLSLQYHMEPVATL